MAKPEEAGPTPVALENRKRNLPINMGGFNVPRIRVDSHLLVPEGERCTSAFFADHIWSA
jgi:hypothetical protein